MPLEQFFQIRVVFMTTPSRSLWGLLDGNIGQFTKVDISFYNLMEYHRRRIKSVAGEVADSTNRSKAFGLTFVLWAAGGSIG